MTTVYGVSAWRYLSTPDVVLNLSRAFGSSPDARDCAERALPQPLPRERTNACESARLVRGRLITDLVGVSLPVHIATSSGCTVRSSRLLTWHHMGTPPQHMHDIDLGNGLWVESPELALLHMALHRSPIQLALLMCEACGIYAIHNSTHRTSLLLHALEQNGTFGPTGPYVNHPGIRAFCDIRGTPLPLQDETGAPLPWEPCITASGQLSDMWKRPPLTSRNKLEACIGNARGAHGVRAAREALRLVRDGSGSFLESATLVMMASGLWIDRADWTWPLLNARVDCTPEARELSQLRYCVADLIWPDAFVAVEPLGAAYHHNPASYERDITRRAALAAMGYTVHEVTYRMLTNPDTCRTIMSTIARDLHMRTVSPSRAARRAQDRFIEEVFRNRRTLEER